MSTVGKALSLLDSVSELEDAAGLSDIARLCALDKATTRRLLVELEKHGFVEQDPDTRKYSIGSAPVRLARIREARYPFLRVAIPFMRELADATEETVHLSQPTAGRLSTIHVEDSTRAHRVIVRVGTYLPFHATASGLAFLAFSGKEEIEKALSKPLEAFTARTVTNPELVRKILADTQARGFSVSGQGFEDDVISCSAPICTPAGKPMATLTIAAPHVRTKTEALERFGSAVLAAARRISEKYYGSEASGIRQKQREQRE